MTGTVLWKLQTAGIRPKVDLWPASVHPAHSICPITTHRHPVAWRPCLHNHYITINANWLTFHCYIYIGEAVAGFTPTWVLVVTWLNLAPDEGCRWRSIYEKLYSHYYWYYWWYSPDHCKDRAWKMAVRK